MMKKKGVLILSGGVDSTTLLYDLLDQGYDIHALCFNYKQRHSKELKMAAKTCKKLNIPYEIINIQSINKLLQGSALTSRNINVPKASYNLNNMKSTIVPNRNMILLSLATARAISLNINNVFYGAHTGDHALYPDCRKEFVDTMKKAIRLSHFKKVNLHAPYINMKKEDIVRKGLKLNVDYSLTWSCYNGRRYACGKCGTCVERLDAFKKNNAKDPIKYEVKI